MTNSTRESKMRTMTSSIDLSKRQFLKGAATAGIGVIAIGAGPCSGPSKEKAVKVTGFIIDLSREAVPLLGLLGAPEIADLVSTKVIPALEKLKEGLSKIDIPTATTTLGTVRSALNGVATALMNLPDSPRRTTIIGILASINVLLLTVQAFVESEMTVKTGDVTALRAAGVGEKMQRVFEATRQ